MALIGVVGAGISGLACAGELKRQGHRVVVFEKSRSLGGRCATRPWEGHVVDHGAQYFTLTRPAWREELETACALRVLQAPVVNAGGGVIPAKGGARYYLKEGNNRLGNYLAADLEVRVEHELREVVPIGGRWGLGGELAEAVVSSAPLPQTESLFKLKLDGAEFVPCLTFFYEYEGAWAGVSRSRYAVSEPSWDMAWSACENHKEGRVAGDRTVLVVQASEAFSRKHLETPPEETAERLRRDLEVMWSLSGVRLLKTFGHRWRHARSRLQVQVSHALLPGLFMAGDSQCESRIETVWESGLATAGRVAAFLKEQGKA